MVTCCAFIISFAEEIKSILHAFFKAGSPVDVRGIQSKSMGDQLNTLLGMLDHCHLCSLTVIKIALPCSHNKD